MKEVASLRVKFGQSMQLLRKYQVGAATLMGGETVMSLCWETPSPSSDVFSFSKNK